MQAVILAGGFGSRLRPLTDLRPKPLLPLANRSPMERMLSLLHRHGCERAVATLYYRADQIQAAFGDHFANIHLDYLIEETPVGTAGSVRLASPFLTEEDFLVVSADVVCEIDLTALLAFHRSRKALATMALTHSNEPGEYGVVLTEADGRIRRFLEKPSRTQACADTVNTGIYCLNRAVLERIPANRPYDFGQDLFPALLGDALYAYVSDAPWCDVGEPQSFYDCSFDYAAREGSLQNGNILGNGAQIASGACVRDSILLEQVHIENGACVTRAIFGENVTVGRNAVIQSGAILGAGCEVGADCVIGEGVTLPCATKVKEGSVCMQHYIFPKAAAQFFSFGAIQGSKQRITPEFALQLGKAAATVAKDGRLAILYADTEYCSLLCSAFRCGVLACGGHLEFHGIGFDALAAFCAVRQSCLTLCIAEEANAHVRIAVFDEHGLAPTRSVERKWSAAFASLHPADPARLGKCVSVEGTPDAYRDAVFAQLGGCDLGELSLYLNHTAPANLFGSVCKKAGASLAATPRALRLIFDPTGQGVSIFESEQEPFCFDFWHVLALLIAHRAIDAQTLPLPYHAPQALHQLAKEHGYQTLCYAQCPHDPAEQALREAAAALPILRDSVLACAALLRLRVEKKTTLAALYKALPPFFTCVREMEIPEAQRLRILCGIGVSDGDGVRMEVKQGQYVRVLPIGASVYRLICEAQSAEAAEELFVHSQRKIQRMAKKLSAPVITEKDSE